EEAVQELFEGDALGVEVGRVQVDALQVRDAHLEGAIVDLDGLLEYVGLSLHLRRVHPLDAGGQGVRGLVGLDLELVGFALLARGPLVADLDEDDLAELAERRRWRQTPSAPESLVAFLDCRNQLALAYRADVLPFLAHA